MNSKKFLIYFLSTLIVSLVTSKSIGSFERNPYIALDNTESGVIVPVLLSFDGKEC